MENTKLKELLQQQQSQVSQMTDDELMEHMKHAQPYDDYGRIVTFINKDEAIVYSNALMAAYPDVGFVRLSEIFSPETGLTWIIEPMKVTEKMDKADVPAGESTRFCLSSSLIMFAGLEYAKRMRAKKEVEQKKLEKNLDNKKEEVK